MAVPTLRSQLWFGGTDLNGFLHRAWIKAEGVTDDALHGRPVIGVANSWSEATNCNSHLRTVAEHVMAMKTAAATSAPTKPAAGGAASCGGQHRTEPHPEV